MTNPYNCTIPGNLFIGRDEIRRELTTGFQNGNSYAVLGGRRCGKTSLLMQLEKDLENKRLGPYTPIPLRFSVQGLGKVTPSMLFEEIYDSVARRTENPPAWETPESGREYRSFLKHLDRIAPNLIETYGPDWLVIMLVDELDAAVVHLKDDQFFQNLRNFLMESRFNRNFRLAATGVKDLASLVFSGSSPLNNLRHKYLGVLNGESSLELVRKGFPDFDEQTETVKTIKGATGGHPYLLQRILEKLWPNTGTDLKSLDPGDFFKQYRDFKSWMNTFGPAEKEVYKILARSPGGTMDILDIKKQATDSVRLEVDDAVTVLGYHGVVDDSTDEIEIAGTMFRDWFLQNNPGIEPSSNEETKQVFISHAKDDLTIAKQLYDDLKKAGVKPWMESEDLIPGQDIRVMTRKRFWKATAFWP